MRTDAEIQQAVMAELRRDPRIEETDVGVEVDAGVVTLTGTVCSSAKRQAAQEAAHRAVGVLDVANDIRIRLSEMLQATDTGIALAVRQALERRDGVPNEQIRSTVSDGMVTLDGTLSTWRQREEAERAVRELTGVLGVLSHLEVLEPEGDPAEVRAAVEAALERRAEREARQIRIDVRDGVATLKGSVHSWSERRAVVGAAGHVSGVRKVIDELCIDSEM
jgi:osmotically-inducible protein OsmY